ncbi:DICT sensory domain-containing protein [Pseudonocardia lacus]|uniref:DICT sensory domain-containing protein n=1 Tax=Pseudonocardia lacus TaxID=2835865 RepID=UPI001BDCF4E8|nr:DICT sensory domain-containing protein [Pseudonocardia lacus]
METSGQNLFGKRVLVELSHAIEQFALAARPGDPLVVLAMFQKASYFAREQAVYRDIAARGAVTVVGLAEDVPPELPPGVRHCLFPGSDELAREWSVTVLGPRGGATLVATDLETVDPGAATLEEGRRFRAGWSFRRADAYGEVLRLRGRLRLPPDLRDQVDEVLHAVLTEPEPAQQDWWNVPLRFLAGRTAVSVDERTRLTAVLAATDADDTERDPRTGLHTERFLHRWTAGLGGSLPVGLALLRVPGLAGLREQFGLRAATDALAGVTGCVRDLLGEGDRLVRLDEEDFLAVLPSWAPDRVLRFCEQACAGIAELDRVYPFVALPAAAAATVTRSRPLPLDELRERVGERDAVSAEVEPAEV